MVGGGRWLGSSEWSSLVFTETYFFSQKLFLSGIWHLRQAALCMAEGYLENSLAGWHGRGKLAGGSTTGEKGLKSLLPTGSSSMIESEGPIWLPYLISFYCSLTQQHAEASTFGVYCNRNIPSRQSRGEAGSVLALSPTKWWTYCFQSAEGWGFQCLVFLKGPRSIVSLGMYGSWTGFGGNVHFDMGFFLVFLFVCLGSNRV